MFPANALPHPFLVVRDGIVTAPRREEDSPYLGYCCGLVGFSRWVECSAVDCSQRCLHVYRKCSVSTTSGVWQVLFRPACSQVFNCRYGEILCSYGNQIAIASPNVAFPQRHRDIARNTENIVRVQKNIRICVWRKGPRKAREFLRKGGLRYQPKFDASKNQAEFPNERMSQL